MMGKDLTVATPPPLEGDILPPRATLEHLGARSFLVTRSGTLDATHIAQMMREGTSYGEGPKIIEGEVLGPHEPGGPRARLNLTNITHDCATFEVEEAGTLTMETLMEAKRKVMEALYGRR